MDELPIIVLAFANEQEGRRYLRKLPEELRELQKILEEAERNGLCRLKLLPNATLDQIFDVFTKNRDKVTILHYAGHADSGRLLLESSAAGGAPAHAAGLATFLGQRRGLQLVFLNGCSTRAQIARLLEAGVAAVIATARAIDDVMAREFAVAFYAELASGAPLRAAYEAARGRVEAAHGAAPEAYYGHRKMVPESSDSVVGLDPVDDQGFPWEFRPGTELVERWSLPDAAGNPEFGLPLLPERDLPESPFRHLAWFTAEHAEVFFGRGYQVRELYEQVTDPSGPPILLLYGASGVGKSSLLDAGLVPRLEAGGAAVRYCRRDQQKGLSGSLGGALQFAGEQTALGEGWRAEEARLAKPLVVFLDQVEEVFTRPEAGQPRELDEFLAALVVALGNRDSRPRGKLVLGFRKEWLAEIDRRLAEAKLPRAKVFLKQLDRRGIIEAIRGPARHGRLQRQYRLAIEDGLPEVIADSLLADAGSALAPTLQVLLTKMWERARQAHPDQPQFDRALYESLKSEGYLLKDVLDEGLKAVGAWNPAVEKSGLAHDLLAYHTTDLGTASQRTRAELDARYAHQADKLDGLLGCCKDHYLILEAEPLPDSPIRSTRLAHDLLAPLVQQRFRLSIAPGQRARRLLENRVPEWEYGKTGSVLDATDLSTVELGVSGMRFMTADEARLVEASRHAEENEKAEMQERERRLHEAEERQRLAEGARQRETEQRLKDQEESNRQLRKRAVALGVTLVVSIVVTLLAFSQWRAAGRETVIANRKTEDAKKAEAKEAIAAENARKQTRLAEDRLKTATSRQLAALSSSERDNRLDLSLLLAARACELDNTFESRDSLLSALQSQPFLQSFLHCDEVQAGCVSFSPDGRTLAVGYGVYADFGGRGRGASSGGRFGGGVLLYDVAGRSRLTGAPLAVAEGGVVSLAFSPDGKTLAAGFEGGGGGQGVVLWDVAGRGRLVGAPLSVAKGKVSSNMRLAFSPDGKTLAAGYIGSPSGVELWDVAGRGRLAGSPLAVAEGMTTSVAFSPDSKTLAAGYVVGRIDDGQIHTGGGVMLWDVAGRSRLTGSPLAVAEGNVADVTFSPDGTILATGYYSGESGDIGGVVVWDMAGRTRLVASPLAVTKGSVVSLAFSPDGKTLAAGCAAGFIGDRQIHKGGGVVLWDATGRDRFAGSPLVVAEAEVRCVAFSPGGKILAAGYSVSFSIGGVVLWDAAGRGRLAGSPLAVAEGMTASVAFSPDGKTLAAGYIDSPSGVVLWDVASRGRLAGTPLTVAEDNSSNFSVAFSPEGKTLAAGYSGSPSGGVVLWDVASRGRLAGPPLAVAEGNVLSLNFSRDGKMLAAGYGDGHGGGAILWDAATRSRLAGSPMTLDGKQILSVAFSPDGKTLAAGYFVDFISGGVVLWDVGGGGRLAAPLAVAEGMTTSVAFSPDGKTLAAGYSGSPSGGVVLWDVGGGGRLAAPLAVAEGMTTSVAFSPDGKTLAAGYSGSPSGGVVLWDVGGGGRLAAPLAVAEGMTTSVAFSPDGKTLAVGYISLDRKAPTSVNKSSEALLWDVNPESWIRKAREIANRDFTPEEYRRYSLGKP